jgi:DNA-binding transcriptional MerR regulator
MMTIGEVAKHFGVTTDTLRYYERIGLLGPITRSRGGQRFFSQKDCAQLAFIRRSQELGFSLAEIEMLLSLRCTPLEARADVRMLAEEKVRELEQKKLSITRMQDELNLLLNLCRHSSGACPILSGLEVRNGKKGHPE